MCIYLIRGLYESLRNRNRPYGPIRPRERQPSKQVPLCEHQLAVTDAVDVDGVLGDKSPTLEHQKISDDYRGPKHCSECIAEEKRGKVYRWKLILAFLIPSIMASMDATITAAALPIASHFSKLTQSHWIATVSLVTSTSSMVIYGQISDVFGRHSVIQASIFFVLIGSVLGAGAQVWVVLLLGRALQGLGFAGLGIATEIILSDKVSLKEYSLNNNLASLLKPLGVRIRPVIGGYLTRASWRWCFIINVPLALLSHIAVFFLLRKDLVKAQLHKRENADGKITIIEKPTILAKLSIIDYGGMLLFSLSSGLIVLAVTWGGETYYWHSAAILVPLIIGCILFVSFCVYEYLMIPGHILSRLFPNQDPMIPLKLFRTRDMGLLTYLNFSAGMALFSVFYYIGTWFTVVQQYDSGKSSAQLAYYMRGLGLGTCIGMLMCNVWPKKTFFPLFLGSILEPLGVGMLTWGLSKGQPTVVSGMFGLAGVGTGLRMMPGMLHAVGICPRFKARGLAIMSFAGRFGGTVGIAVIRAGFRNSLSQHISSTAKISSTPRPIAIRLEVLPPDVQAVARGWYNDAIVWAYIAILPFFGLAGVVVFFLGNVKVTSQKQDATGEINTTGNIEDVPYLWWLATGAGPRDAAMQAQALEKRAT